MAEVTPFAYAFSRKVPQQLFTEGYLNDPIKFETDIRLDPEVIIREEDFYTVIGRDEADFAKLNLGATGSVFYPVSTISPTFSRPKYFAQINTIFTTF